MIAPTEQLDPESLVARIIDELEANPAAQKMLLRAMLTNEFMGVPARLDHIESTIREMKIDIEALKNDVSVLQTDVAVLKGDNLEFKLPRRIRPFLSQKLGLRRPRMMQTMLALDAHPDLLEPVEAAFDEGRITAEQEGRLGDTDLILRAQRVSDRTPVWLAVEASSSIANYDVERARQSADLLRMVFDEDAIAVAVGYSAPDAIQARARERGVEVFLVQEVR